MASPEKIEEFVNQQVQFVRQNTPRIKYVVDEQRKREAQIIEQTQSFCPLKQLEDRTARAEDIEKALKDGYGDENVLKSLMCLNNSMIAFPKSAGLGRNFKVREYLQNLKQIGGESADGYAMLADVKGKVKGENLFVVKAPRRIDPELRANQIHEYFVGAYGTNNLRNSVPNFAFILGLFQCSPPYIDNGNYLTNNLQDERKRQGLTFCQNDLSENEVNYLLYENVANAKTLLDFIVEGASFEDFLNVFTQVVLALDLAYQELDFTHYDLHTENVLVRELPEEIYIPYVIDEAGTTKYLQTKYVATIIDFGRSHIRYQGNNYGYAMIEFGLFPDRSYPMYDVYKLLMFSIADAAFGNNDMRNYAGYADPQLEQSGMIVNLDIFQKGKDMMGYFNPTIPRDRYTNELIYGADYAIVTRSFYYSFPYFKEYNIRPIKFYQDVLTRVYPIYINNFIVDNVPTIDSVYGCSKKGVCQTLQQAISNYSQDDEDLLHDPYVFYEAVIEGENKQGDLTEVIQKGEKYYPDYISKLNADAEFNFLYYLELDEQLVMMSLSQQYQFNTSMEIKFSNEYLEEYRSFVSKAVKMVDLMTTILTIKTVILKINDIYPELSDGDYMKLFNETHKEITRLNNIIKSIQIDVGYINQLDERQILAYNPQAQWLFQKMPTLTSAIVQLQY